MGFALVVGGCVCRLVATTQQPWSITLLHLSYVFNAIAGPVAMGCVSKVAENWFPAAERATATAIAAGASVCQLQAASSWPGGIARRTWLSVGLFAQLVARTTPRRVVLPDLCA